MESAEPPQPAEPATPVVADAPGATTAARGWSPGPRSLARGVATGDPSSLVEFLASTSDERRADVVLDRQRKSGNRSVTRLLSRAGLAAPRRAVATPRPRSGTSSWSWPPVW